MIERKSDFPAASPQMLSACGFRFILTNPDNYGLQGEFIYTIFQKLKLHLLAGKIVKQDKKSDFQTLDLSQVKVTLLANNKAEHDIAISLTSLANGWFEAEKSTDYSLRTLLIYTLTRRTAIHATTAQGENFTIELPPSTIEETRLSNCVDSLTEGLETEYKKRHNSLHCLQFPKDCGG